MQLAIELVLEREERLRRDYRYRNDLGVKVVLATALVVLAQALVALAQALSHRGAPGRS